MWHRRPAFRSAPRPRALTGTGLTSERTQQRLTRIARELGYRPNPIARGLKTGQSRLVALLVHNLTNASFQVMAEVVQARLKALGYQMLLCIGGDDPQQESDTLTTLVDHRIDGLIVVPTGKNGAQLKTLAKDVPIVCLVRRDDATDLETVLADDPQGAYLGTRHLIELGHKRIGLIVGRQDTTSGRERLSGYVRALREAGIAARRHIDPCRPFRAGDRCDLLPQAARPPAPTECDLRRQPRSDARRAARDGGAQHRDPRRSVAALLRGHCRGSNGIAPPSASSTMARAISPTSPSTGCCSAWTRRATAVDGVREYRVGARLIKRDSCRQIDAPIPARSGKRKSSPSKSSAAKSSAAKSAKV